MYKSKEIRWFFSDSLEPVDQWFAQRNLFLSSASPRTDFYLPIPGKNDITYKLREGNIEAKFRNGEPISYNLTDTASGKLEEWIKWSFNVTDDDELATNIIKSKKFSWVEVVKTRIGVKLFIDNAGQLKVVDIKQRVPDGIQIEYTKIVINDRPSYSFCFEWFGDSDLKPEKNFIDELTGTANLIVEESMGYGEFLNK